MNRRTWPRGLEVTSMHWHRAVADSDTTGRWSDVDWNGKDENDSTFIVFCVRRSIVPRGIEEIVKAGLDLNLVGRRTWKRLVGFHNSTVIIDFLWKYSTVRPVPFRVLEIFVIYTRTFTLDRMCRVLSPITTWKFYKTALNSGWRFRRDAVLLFNAPGFETAQECLQMFSKGMSLFILDNDGLEFWIRARDVTHYTERRAVTRAVRAIVALKCCAVWRAMPVQHQRMLVDFFIGPPINCKRDLHYAPSFSFFV